MNNSFIRLASIALLAFHLPVTCLGQQRGATYYDLLKQHPKEVYGMNASGQYHGTYKSFFTDGTPELIRTYSNGELNGIETLYYNNGNTRGLAQVNNWKSGRQDGVQKSYSDDQAPGGYAKYVHQEEMYSMGSLIWRKSYENDGAKVYLREEEAFQSKTGICASRKFLFADGRIWRQELWDGRNFEEGNPLGNKAEFWNVNGVKQGPFTAWYKNGQVAEQGFYRDGELDSVYKSFYDNGALWQEEYYNRGKLTVGRILDKQGTRVDSVNATDPVYHGKWLLAKGRVDSAFGVLKGAADRNMINDPQQYLVFADSFVSKNEGLGLYWGSRMMDDFKEIPLAVLGAWGKVLFEHRDFGQKISWDSTFALMEQRYPHNLDIIYEHARLHYSLKDSWGGASEIDKAAALFLRWIAKVDLSSASTGSLAKAYECLVLWRRQHYDDDGMDKYALQLIYIEPCNGVALKYYQVPAKVDKKKQKQSLF